MFKKHNERKPSRTYAIWLTSWRAGSTKLSFRDWIMSAGGSEKPATFGYHLSDTTQYGGTISWYRCNLMCDG